MYHNLLCSWLSSRKDADLEHKYPRFFLGLVQTMLDDIDLSQANAAFLVRRLDDNRQLVCKEKHAPRGHH